MTTCPTRSLLLQTLAPGPVDATQLQSLLRSADLDTFATLAAAHAVAPAAAASLHASAAHLPPDWADWAETCLFETTARNGWILHHLGLITAALQDAGLRFFALKGCDLLLTTYEQIGARHLDDIDLLFHPDDLAAASAALLAAGYPLQSAGTEVPFVDGTSYADYVASQAAEKIHPAVHESADGLSIELHRMLPESEQPAADFDRLWEGRTTHERDGLHIPLLPREELTRHLCVHAFVQHHGDWRILARHLADALRLHRAGWLSDTDAPAQTSLPLRLTKGLVALHASAAPPAAATLTRLVFPGPHAQRLWDQSIFQRLLLQRIAHDALHQPQMLLRKLLPSDDYLAYHYGDEALAAGRKRLLLKRLAMLPFRPFTGAR